MLTVLTAESRRDKNGRKRVVEEMLTGSLSHFSSRHRPLSQVACVLSSLCSFFKIRPHYTIWDPGTGYPQTNCLISYRAGAWHYRIFPDFSKSPVSKWRIVRVKTRTKAFFFEEILINIPSENLPKLSKERMQYFCHTLKLTWRSRYSASASNCSMKRSFEPKMIINFVQQRILCLILPASVK